MHVQFVCLVPLHSSLDAMLVTKSKQTSVRKLSLEQQYSSKMREVIYISSGHVIPTPVLLTGYNMSEVGVKHPLYEDNLPCCHGHTS